MKQAQLIEMLLDEVLVQIERAGMTARKGQIADSALVPVPKQRNPREGNTRIKAGEVPEDLAQNTRCQKDVQARWTKKHGLSHYGYKHPISADRQHKVIHKYAMTSAEVHGSQVFDALLDEHNSSADFWADDAAHRSAEREAELSEARYRSHIHRKATRTRPHNAREQEANRKRSSVRARVEHMCAQQTNRLVRTIGLARAAVKIGIMNLVYNMCRLAWYTG